MPWFLVASPTSSRPNGAVVAPTDASSTLTTCLLGFGDGLGLRVYRGEGGHGTGNGSSALSTPLTLPCRFLSWKATTRCVPMLDGPAVPRYGAASVGEVDMTINLN